MKSERELILEGICDPAWSAEAERCFELLCLEFDSHEEQTSFLRKLFEPPFCRRRDVGEIVLAGAMQSFLNGAVCAFGAMLIVEDAIAGDWVSDSPHVESAWRQFSEVVGAMSAAQAAAASRWCSLVSEHMNEAKDTHGARLWLIASFHAGSRFLGAEIGRVHGEIVEHEKDYALQTGSVPDWWDQAGARSGENDCVAAVMGEMVASLDEAVRAARLIQKLSDV
jgi:hypothetical protein